MKNIVKKLCFAALAVLFLIPSSAAAPPRKDGVVFSGNVDCGKKIALTFDDGPHPYKTAQILDILGKHGVKGTFFVIGANAQSYADLVTREHREGHEVANHSYSHTRLSAFTEAQVKEELAKTDEIIKKATGQTPRLFRPPEGAYSEISVKTAKEMGKVTVIWTVDTLDWAMADKNTIVKNVKNNVRDGSIILFHDFTRKGAHTAEALEELIPYLKSQGFEFVTVSELVG